MQPEDILWRVIDRLQESKEILDEIIGGLHPVKEKEIMDALIEVERLTQTQIQICRRVQRRLERGR